MFTCGVCEATYHGQCGVGCAWLECCGAVWGSCCWVGFAELCVVWGLRGPAQCGVCGRVFCGVMLRLEAPKAPTQQPRKGGFGAPGLSFLVGRGNGRTLLSELTVLLEGCMRSWTEEGLRALCTRTHMHTQNLLQNQAGERMDPVLLISEQQASFSLHVGNFA